MKSYLLIFAIAILIIGGAIYSVNLHNGTSSIEIDYELPTIEVEPRFLVSGDRLFFSGFDSIGTRLYSVSNNEISDLDMANTIKPFLFKDEVVGLIDSVGDRYYHSTSRTLNKLLKDRKLNSIFSFQKGSIVVFSLENDDNLYVHNVATGSTFTLLTGVNRVHSVCYWQSGNSFIVNYDNKLTLVSDKNVVLIAENGTTEKMNPSIDGHFLYYSSNSKSEFHRIYRLNLSKQSFGSEMVFQTTNDVRMPRCVGDTLYFIEVINNEYLLRSYSRKNARVKNITQRGIVYEYDFLKGNLYYTYSDLSHPRSLMKYNVALGSKERIVGDSLATKFSSNLVKGQNGKSPAYILEPEGKGIKGVIIFIHAGLNFDFSPRWDTFLMNLANYGFLIVAPNSPMSSGLGKSYFNRAAEDAFSDLLSWTTAVSKEYSELPLYVLSYSSGTTVAEILLTEAKDIEGAVSLFGIPAEGVGLKTPSLYILGEKDPLVNYNIRLAMLEKLKRTNNNILWKAYSEEGHMFRKHNNVRMGIEQAIRFFESNQD